MKNKFVDTFGDRALTAIAYSFNPDFQGVIRRLMEAANDPRNKTYRSTDSKIYEINSEIESTKNTVLESIEKVLDRGEKIELGAQIGSIGRSSEKIQSTQQKVE